MAGTNSLLYRVYRELQGQLQRQHSNAALITEATELVCKGLKKAMVGIRTFEG